MVSVPPSLYRPIAQLRGQVLHLVDLFLCLIDLKFARFPDLFFAAVVQLIRVVIELLLVLQAAHER